MARLDKVKNLTGLAAWYGANPRLRGLVNLVIVGGWRAALRLLRPLGHGMCLPQGRCGCGCLLVGAAALQPACNTLSS